MTPEPLAPRSPHGRPPVSRPSMPPPWEPELERLWRRWMNRWWLAAVSLCLTVLPWSLWELRATWRQLHAYFTWVALHYGLAYSRWPALGLGLCIGLVVALMVGESRHLIWGLSRQERYYLLRTWRRRRRR